MKNILVVASAVLCLAGCKPREVASNEPPKDLPHRYEESVLLDQATVNCWHWRPLPDSLCLEGYDGFRYIARLKGLPPYHGGAEFPHYRAQAEIAGREAGLDEFLQPGGGIQDCDVVWDVFWKSDQKAENGDFVYRDRCLLIEEKPTGTNVMNRPSVHEHTIHLPEGTSLSSRDSSFYRTIPVKIWEKQNLFSLTLHSGGAQDSSAGNNQRATTLKWFWAIGPLHSQTNAMAKGEQNP